MCSRNRRIVANFRLSERRFATILLLRELGFIQPRSQGLSSYRLGQARRDRGLVWSRATVTIENIREGSSVIRQFVALSFVALSRHRHHTRCLKVVFGLKF